MDTRFERFELLVAGAGPAGMAAAIAAARMGRRVGVLDKAARPGVKILLSGGNRCNLTHDCDAAEISKAFGRAGAKFLGAALRELGPRELRAWIESLGVPTKVEPGGKVFPISDRAVDVRDALERELVRSGAIFIGKAAVRSVAIAATERATETFVVETTAGTFTAPQLVLAMGGQSYPRVGTTGDGYALAVSLGHTLVPPTPALVPLLIDVPWMRELSGVTLDDVTLALEVIGRVFEQCRGGFLFTHFGLSGPAPMNLGGAVAEALASSVAASVALRINFLPSTTRATLESQLTAAASTSTMTDQRLLRTWLADRLPRRVAESLLLTAKIPLERALPQIANSERGRLLDALFATRVPVAGTRGFDFAEVTRGGVALYEVDPTTLASRVVPGLYLAGELLYLDGPIGGYNFTAAFATGMLAGHSAAAAGAKLPSP